MNYSIKAALKLCIMTLESNRSVLKNNNAKLQLDEVIRIGKEAITKKQPNWRSKQFRDGIYVGAAIILLLVFLLQLF